MSIEAHSYSPVKAGLPAAKYKCRICGLGQRRCVATYLPRIQLLEQAGHDLREARCAQKKALALARQAGLTALDAGYTEAEVARCLGVDRMTVRKWRGKR